MFRFELIFLLFAVLVQGFIHENSGPVQRRCLNCICKMESGCQPIGCRMDVGSFSCGYYQIKEKYWIDCGRLGNDWRSCANNKTCSSQCVENYMKRYINNCPKPHTCEDFARQHNGGPHGCTNSATLKYWEKLKSLEGCGDLENLKFESVDQKEPFPI